MQTERLQLRRFTLDDAPFIHHLVNDPAWIANIGDRGVRNLEDARRYIGRTLAMYERHGFGMYVVELRQSGRPIGTCGLVKRDGFEHADIGFAFLPEFRGRGFAREAAAAVMKHARDDLGLDRVVAIVTPANKPSISLLEKIGLRFERFTRMPGDNEEIAVYTT
jgi:ribosomal-protein-alanine N-acetyltransferase